MVIGGKEIQEEENWEHFSIYNLSIHAATWLVLGNVKEAHIQKGMGAPLYKAVMFIFSYLK